MFLYDCVQNVGRGSGDAVGGSAMAVKIYNYGDSERHRGMIMRRPCAGTCVRVFMCRVWGGEVEMRGRALP